MLEHLILSHIFWMLCSSPVTLLPSPSLCFSLGNFYWPILQFTDPFLTCIKATDETCECILYLLQIKYQINKVSNCPQRLIISYSFYISIKISHVSYIFCIPSCMCIKSLSYTSNIYNFIYYPSINLEKEGSFLFLEMSMSFLLLGL